MKRIVLTGGGTAGHVTPNIALLPKLKEAGYEITYIGSYQGMERALIEAEHIDYIGISSGKLRRYLDLKNLSDPFRVLKGFFEAKRHLKRIKPHIVFSKGGFVSVPVVLAAKWRRIPVVIHESDLSIGLANRIAIKGATKVCCNFPETLERLPKQKGVLTGSPIREGISRGDRGKGLRLCGFDTLAGAEKKETILIMGGSQGSVKINGTVRELLPRLLPQYNIIHLCGRGNLDAALTEKAGYYQMEYASGELPDLFAAADLIISRAGANSIAEYLSLAKPNLLIPLSAQASRGDQILNARSYEKQGYSEVLMEEEMTADRLYEGIIKLDVHKEQYIEAMKQAPVRDSAAIIMELLEQHRRTYRGDL